MGILANIARHAAVGLISLWFLGFLFAAIAVCKFAELLGEVFDSKRHDPLRYTVAPLLALLAIASTAHAGGYGYCNTCYHAPVQTVVATPTTIIEHQQNFYSVGDAVRQYAVMPQAVAQAEYQALLRKQQAIGDQLAEMKQRAAYQAPYQAVACCVPVCPQPVCPPTPQPMPPAPQPVPAPTPMPPQPVPPQPTPQPEPGGPVPPDDPNHLNAPNSIVQASCVKCHSADKHKGDFDITGNLDLKQKLTAINKVAIGEMPKGGPKFTHEQVQQLASELLTPDEQKLMESLFPTQK